MRHKKLDSSGEPPSVLTSDVTQLLSRVRAGSDTASERLFALVYDQLRGLAGRYMSRESVGHTLQPTALVHEAYLKLMGDQPVGWRDRAHFIGVVARAMRQILVNHAIRRRAEKRGGHVARVPLDDVIAAIEERSIDLVALDEALKELAVLDERQSRIVELRFFAGLSVKDTASVIGISPRTVDRESQIARGWLYREIASDQ